MSYLGANRPRRSQTPHSPEGQQSVIIDEFGDAERIVRADSVPRALD